MEDHPEPTAVASLIVAKSAELRENLASLSRQIGKNHAYLQQFVQRRIPRELPEGVREKLAELLRIEPDQLRSAALPAVQRRRFPPSLSAGNRPPEPLQTRFPRALADLQPPIEITGHTVPLMGQGAAGTNGAFPFNGERAADIPAPPTLQRVRAAYAIYVVGNSMEPRYEQGEIVFVDPTRPARRGDYVVVQIADEEGTPLEGYIKQYIGQSQKHLKLSQFNPKKELTFPLSQVKSIGVIVFAGKG